MKTTLISALSAIINPLKKMFQRDRMQSVEEDSQVIADQHYAEGKAFLASNGKRQEVITTTSGLQYEILTHADGAKPTTSAKVTVHYQGTFLNGTEFDSSYTENQPASFALNRHST